MARRHTKHNTTHIMRGILRIALSISLIITTTLAAAQSITVHGRVTSPTGDALPYASVFVRETLQGTATNSNGEYALGVPAADTIHIVFQSMGYQIAERSVSAMRDTAINITLQPSTIFIREVTAYASEDPAYPIMRHAILNAPLHHKKLKSYNAQTYIKGTVRFDAIPTIMANKMPETDRTYIIESINSITFEAPNTYKHTVISEQNSMPDFDLGNNTKLRYFNLDLYDTSNDDIIISPLASNAMSHYNFEHIGTSTAFGQTINHIKVVPKRQSKQLFSGTIDIADSTWQITHASLQLSTAIGELNTVLNYIPINNNVWMPVLQNYELGISFMGVRGNMKYVGSLNYTNVEYSEPENVILAKHPITDDQVSASAARVLRLASNSTKLSDILQKPSPTNADVRRANRYWRRQENLSTDLHGSLEIKNRLNYTFVDTINNARSAQWELIRPIPLTDDEVDGFELADTTRAQRALLPQTETSAAKPSKKVHVSVMGLSPDMLYYTPVTGFTPQQSITLSIDSRIKWSITGTASYAISAKQWMAWLKATAQIGRNHTLWTQIGRDYHDWKEPLGNSRFTNTFSSLFSKRSYRKVVDKEFVSLNYEGSPAWGLNVKAWVKRESITPVENTTNYSFFKRNHTFAPNIPINKLTRPEHLTGGRQTAAAISVSYTPRLRYYRDSGGNRVAVGSRVPTFTAGIEQGLGAINEGMSNYTHASFSIAHMKAFSLADKFNWMISGGVFSNSFNTGFANWKHYAGSNRIFALADMATGYKGYTMFTPYELSTNDWYIDITGHYQTQALMLKRIPALGKWLYTEELFLKSALIAGNDLYTEIGYGIGHIMLILRMSAFVSFHNEEFQMVRFRMALSLADLLGRIR